MDSDLMIILVILVILIIIVVIGCWLSNKSTQEMMEPIQENTFPFQTFIINLDRKPERYKYVSEQLNKFKIYNYSKWVATDGFKVKDEEMLEIGVSQTLINKGRGLAGCASSHMKLWKHIADNNLDWVLILEDDAHFHPQFMNLFHQYWNKTPKNSKIIFPGWCTQENGSVDPIIESSCMCLHGYMINGINAKYLLNNLPEMDEPIDIIITEYFRNRSGIVMFNGNANMNGIRPNNYKFAGGRCCMFNGIIYQNHEQQGSTIHKEETVF